MRMEKKHIANPSLRPWYSNWRTRSVSKTGRGRKHAYEFERERIDSRPLLRKGKCMTDEQKKRLDEIDALIKSGVNDPKLFNERDRISNIANTRIVRGHWMHGRKR
jgi:hypothetical protein